MKAEISSGEYSRSPRLTRSSPPILRLIERTVRSGASTYWLSAVCPTITRPSSDNPTTEGTNRSSPRASTRGRPSSTMATSEFVVPRSIPTVLLILSDYYLSVSQNFAVERVASPLFADDCPRRNIAARFGRDGAVARWVERLPFGFDLADARALQNYLQSLVKQFLAVEPLAERRNRLIQYWLKRRVILNFIRCG